GRRELPTARHGADGSAVTIGARTAAARKSARAASSEALRRPGIEVAPGPRAKGYGDGTREGDSHVAHSRDALPLGAQHRVPGRDRSTGHAGDSRLAAREP